MANLGAQAGSGFDASDLTTGTLGNTVQDNITRLGTVTTGTFNGTIGTNDAFPAGHVVQYKSVIVVGNQSTNQTSFQHLSAYDLAITPQYNNSKIILFWSGNWYQNGDNRHGYFTIYKDANNLGNASEGLRLYQTPANNGRWHNANVYHIDVSGSTSSITYKVYIRSQNNDTTFRICYDANSYTSNFSLMEIKE